MPCTLALLGGEWWHEIEAPHFAKTRQLCVSISLASLVKLATPSHRSVPHRWYPLTDVIARKDGRNDSRCAERTCINERREEDYPVNVCPKRTAVLLGNAITSVSVTMHRYISNCRENRMWTATFCQCNPFINRVLAKTCRLRTLSKGQVSGNSMNPSAIGFGGLTCSRRKLRKRPAAVSSQRTVDLRHGSNPWMSGGCMTIFRGTSRNTPTRIKSSCTFMCRSSSLMMRISVMRKLDMPTHQGRS